MPPEQPCRLCGGPARKIRLQVFPWKYECVWVCRGCEPRAVELIQKIRAELLGETS